MPPGWLTALSWAALAPAFGSAGWITFDVHGRSYRQQMGIIEAFWPVTALHVGPAAVAAYRAWGRPMNRRWPWKRRVRGVRPRRVDGRPGARAEYIGDYLAALGLGIVFQYLVAGFFTAWPVYTWLIRVGIAR
jgi:hypothetical protein